jgi:adenine/guanine phosphoribosyltransferase-like PRPP-binding protein
MMERTEAIRLLAAGGVPATTFSGTTTSDAAATPRYDGLSDPTGCAALAKALADQLGTFPVDAILIGAGIEEAVLAAFVAREFGVRVIRSYIDEGLMFAPALEADMKLILLADVFRTEAALQSLWSLANERGSVVVGVAALFESKPLTIAQPNVATAVLVRSGNDAV